MCPPYSAKQRQLKITWSFCRRERLAMEHTAESPKKHKLPLRTLHPGCRPTPPLTCVWDTAGSNERRSSHSRFYACAERRAQFCSVLQWITKDKINFTWSDTVIEQSPPQLYRQSLMIKMYWFYWMFIYHGNMFSPFDNPYIKEWLLYINCIRMFLSFLSSKGFLIEFFDTWTFFHVYESW